VSKGGGGGTSTTVQKADPWSGLQPYLQQLYSSAGDWFNSPNPQYYPGQTVAGQAPETEAALGAGTQRALAGSQNLRAAQGQNLATIGGQYLGSNPYLDSMFTSATTPMVNQFKNAIAPSLASQFSSAGRTGSGAHQQAIIGAEGQLAQGLSSAASSLYGNAYENERGRQQQAISMAPGFASADYADLDKLMGIGQYRQQTAQNLLNANRERYDFGQNQPLQKLQSLNQLLQGGSVYGGSTSTGTTNQASNPFAGALGGASTAYGLGNALGGMTGSTAMGAIGGPLGLGIGALLGGLFGG
jgi:hypothetical protein